jgi:general stress protein YciG
MFTGNHNIHSSCKTQDMQENQKPEQQKSRRGFAAMSPERQREIASQGGRAAHQQGVAHEWSADEARQAGRKGGQISGRKRSNGSNETRGIIL